MNSPRFCKGKDKSSLILQLIYNQDKGKRNPNMNINAQQAILNAYISNISSLYNNLR